MNARPRLVFVYNADSGLFNTLADAAHKILSPQTYQCALCKVTYGWFQERGAWRAFLDTLDADCEFLHRDELHARFPDLAVDLPAVLCLGKGQPTLCIDAQRLQSCRDLDELMGLVRAICRAPSAEGSTGAARGEAP
jgi:hypothetical protein